MKVKKISFIISILLVCTILFSCNHTISQKQDKLQIISTIFPGYDFAKAIAGDKAEVTMLIPPGSDAHSYEPSPRDIIKIQNCDLFIYIGGEGDEWVEDILSTFENPPKTLKMTNCVKLLTEDIKEGMQEEDHLTSHVELDEHVWTHPQNAVEISDAIGKALSEIAPDNKDFYVKSTADYTEKLKALDKEFTDFFANVENKTLIFGDRFPLRYFAYGYGLNYYAAFPGCSSETEPSAATVAFLIDKVRTENISTIFYIEFSNHKIADSIAEATNIKTAIFHTCHNVSNAELAEGKTYLSLMQNNLETLKGAMK